VRCVTVASLSKVERKSPAQLRVATEAFKKKALAIPRRLYADFYNKIGTFPTWPIELTMSVLGGKTDSQPTSWKRRE
jgi:hypothetical protein